MITRVVKMEFESSYIADFKTLFKHIKPTICNFEGCISVKLLQHESELNIFFTMSHWENADALENYRNSDFFKSTWQEVKKKFSSKAEAWSLIEA